MVTLTPNSETNEGANEMDHVSTLLIHCCPWENGETKEKRVQFVVLTVFGR